MPSKAEILQWISDNPTLTSKRDIAKAFGIKGAARIDLKRILKELEDEGHLEKRKKTYRDPDRLPPVSVLQVSGQTDDGELLARPLEWQGDRGGAGGAVIPRASDPALGQGDRILARLQEVKGEAHHYEARLIRRIGTNPRKVLGIFRTGEEGGRIVPIDKGDWQGMAGRARCDRRRAGWRAGRGRTGRAQGAARPAARAGAGPAGRSVGAQGRVADRDPSARHPGRVSRRRDRRGRRDGARRSGGREDLRDLPLITIDPWDARDHDDAIFAHADDDPANEGGHVIWVAIADVAHHVRPGSAWMPRRGGAAIPAISRPRGADAARPAVGRSVLACTRACRAPAWRCACRSTPPAKRSGTVSCAG